MPNFHLGMACTPEIPATVLRRLSYKNCRFEASADNLVRLCLKKQKQKKQTAEDIAQWYRALHSLPSTEGGGKGSFQHEIMHTQK